MENRAGGESGRPLGRLRLYLVQRAEHGGHEGAGGGTDIGRRVDRVAPINGQGVWFLSC